MCKYIHYLLYIDLGKMFHDLVPKKQSLFQVGEPFEFTIVYQWWNDEQLGRIG